MITTVIQYVPTPFVVRSLITKRRLPKTFEEERCQQSRRDKRRLPPERQTSTAVDRNIYKRMRVPEPNRDIRSNIFQFERRSKRCPKPRNVASRFFNERSHSQVFQNMLSTRNSFEYRRRLTLKDVVVTIVVFCRGVPAALMLANVTPRVSNLCRLLD